MKARILALVCLALVCFARESRAQLLITEIAAMNKGTLRDNDLEFSDFVEIYNNSPLPVNLNGWRLTDDASRLSKWVFPATNIAPRSFMLVFASGKNRAVAGAALHANFSLGDREYLALVRPNGQVEKEFAPRYPQQYPDVSYGLAFNNGAPGTNHLYFQAMTPNTTNGAGFPEVSRPVVFSEPGGVYTNNLTVTLSSPHPEAVIKYTLDGRDPTTNGIVYTTPFSVSDSRYIRARAYEPGLAHSEVRAEAYTLLAADVIDFSSNLPLLIINSFGRSIPENTRVPTYATLIHTNGGNRADLLQAPNYRGRARMAIRGSSSTQFPKKSYAFETNDEQDTDLKVSLLGLPAESDWVLYAPYTDKTLMRDVLAYEMSNRVGRYAPRTRFIEVFVNTGNKVKRSDYVGVYVLIEKIRRDPNRVPIEELLPSMTSMPEISGGYILKIDRIDPGDAGFSTTRVNPIAYVDPKEREASPAQKTWIRSWLNSFEAALYSANFRTNYANYIEVDSFIDNFWLVEFCKNIDGYRLSTYLYKPRNEKLRLGPAWDYNLSLGNADYNDGYRTNGWYYPMAGANSAVAWINRLRVDSEYKQREIDLWHYYRREHWRTEQILQQVDEWAALLEEAQQRNYQKWRIFGIDIWPNWYVGRNYADEVNWMKNWISGRFNWIDSQMTPPPTFAVSADPQAGVTLHMQAAKGLVLYTLDGSDPRTNNGANAAKALTFTGAIPVTKELLITARAKSGTNWSGQVQTALTPVSAWKTLHFTAEEAANPEIGGDFADPDGDSQLNWQEYAASTNPKDPDDHLKLNAGVAAGRAMLEFQTAPGRSYTLERRVGLSGGAWSQAAFFPAATARSPQQFDATTTNKQAFYRLIVHP